MGVGLRLAVHLDRELDRFMDLLRAILIIHTQLHDIAILKLMWYTLRISRTETKIVDESATGGFGVFDVDLAVVGPDFCMSPGDGFAFEGEVVGGEDVDGLAIYEASDAQRCVAVSEIAGDGLEAKGIEVEDKADVVG
jgi:hypothetical protein